MSGKTPSSLPYSFYTPRRIRVTYPLKDVRPELKTQQQFKDECDMNRIVQNAQRGVPSRFAREPGSGIYGDFSEVPDMTQALNKINSAKDAFMTLPARLRLELGNDFTRIDELTAEQIEYYRLSKPREAAQEPETPSPAPQKKPKASTLPKAGQAAVSDPED